MTTQIITRKDYMANRATHSEYYAQFVTPEVLSTVRQYIGEGPIMKSTDPHFNDIPLARWDALSQHHAFRSSDLHNAVKASGDYLTLSGIVCIAKEAARQIQTACQITSNG